MSSNSRPTGIWHSKLRVVAVGVRICNKRRSALVVVMVVGVVVVVVFVRCVVVAKRPVVVCSQQPYAILCRLSILLYFIALHLLLDRSAVLSCVVSLF